MNNDKSRVKIVVMLVLAMLMMTAIVASVDSSSEAASTTTKLIVQTDPSYEGVVITADPISSSYSNVYGTTDGTGAATLTLATATDWYISGAAVGTMVSQLKTFSPESGVGAYAITLEYNEKFTYSVVYNSASFASGSSDALTYADDADGMIAVTSTATTLSSATPNSWLTSDEMLSYCYYAVFASDGHMIGKLNPTNLTKYRDGTDASADITTCNVMWCVPTLYLSATSDTNEQTGVTTSTLSISNDPSSGSAKYHTIDGHIYEYLAYGVYEGTVTAQEKLMSISGATPTGSKTLTQFEDLADNNIVKNGKAMVWTYNQEQLYRYIVLMTVGFDSQSIGLGNTAGTAASTTGLTDTMGMFAGNTLAGSSDSVKCYLENTWGSLSEWVGDAVTQNYMIYAGSNSVNTNTTESKELVFDTDGSRTANGYPTAISTDLESWGIGTSFTSGASTKGTYDSDYLSTDGTVKSLCVGGSWAIGAGAGVSGLNAATVGDSHAGVGARLAYVYDADPASELETCDVTFAPLNGTQAEVTVQIPTGESIGSSIYTPVRANYTFGGWYDSTFMNEYTADSVITEDTVLYGYWIPMSTTAYTVIFDSAGGTGTISYELVNYGGMCIEPRQPAKDGYVFSGWFTEEGTEFNFSTSVSESITLTAHYNVYHAPVDRGISPFTIVLGFIAVCLVVWMIFINPDLRPGLILLADMAILALNYWYQVF
ncbi:MAG: InlB B-repeat-containing protein [Methanosarcina mazei]|nr:InlB B-repeat-containing protein [Methanosarcina mazei]